jgi:hypothetical protein
MAMNDATFVREWDSDTFHYQVLEMESKGYNVRRETYQVTAEMNPETGQIIHLYTVEMYKPDSDPARSSDTR